MGWLKGLQHHSWRLAGVSIVGLLVAIAVAGMIALGVNERVRSILVQTIQYDLALEDRADDLRIAVLEMRHYHRNIVFAGPSPRRIEDFENAFQQLQSYIDQLDQLGLNAPNLLSPDELRELAARYYAGFRPAIDRHDTNQQAFELASDDGLWLLAELESDAHRIERFGENEATGALQSVEVAANRARALLIGKLIGHILIGAGLAYLIVRILREQQQAAAQLAHTLQLKTDFIADISHELRTPLTVMRANVEVALDLERNCVHTELLEEIFQETTHMTRLVEDLLFLARSDSGALPLDWTIANIRPLLQEVAERAISLAREHKISFQPDQIADGAVRIDRTRIVQAVLILIDNAAKYSPPETTITLTSMMNSTEIVIEVADQGPGIPKEDLPYIFERFFRVDKARTRKTGGAGLGLAIAKSIIVAHGGRIEAESVLNQGSKMRLYLPSLNVTNPQQYASDQPLINEISTVSATSKSSRS